MGKLAVVRHGQSEWNALGLWTGLEDPNLTELGQQQARNVAEHLTDLLFDRAYASELRRSQQTLMLALAALEQLFVDVTVDAALNERDYGVYTGQNKWQVKDKLGEIAFHSLRRDWNYPIPEGQTLKDVYDKVTPLYERELLPGLQNNENYLVCSSGNTIRALAKHIEDISVDDIADIEIGVGETWVYEINDAGDVLDKDVRLKGLKA